MKIKNLNNNNKTNEQINNSQNSQESNSSNGFVMQHSTGNLKYREPELRPTVKRTEKYVKFYKGYDIVKIKNLHTPFTEVLTYPQGVTWNERIEFDNLSINKLNKEYEGIESIRKVLSHPNTEDKLVITKNSISLLGKTDDLLENKKILIGQNVDNIEFLSNNKVAIVENNYKELSLKIFNYNDGELNLTKQYNFKNENQGTIFDLTGSTDGKYVKFRTSKGTINVDIEQNVAVGPFVKAPAPLDNPSVKMIPQVGFFSESINVVQSNINVKHFDLENLKSEVGVTSLGMNQLANSQQPNRKFIGIEKSKLIQKFDFTENIRKSVLSPSGKLTAVLGDHLVIAKNNSNLDVIDRCAIKDVQDFQFISENRLVTTQKKYKDNKLIVIVWNLENGAIKPEDRFVFKEAIFMGKGQPLIESYSLDEKYIIISTSKGKIHIDREKNIVGGNFDVE